MSESTKNEESSNSLTSPTEQDFLPGMVECENCGKMKGDVSYVANPYDADVNNETVMQWLCGTCYQEYADDI